MNCKKTAVITGLFSICLFIATGCNGNSNLTSEQIINKMVQNTKNIESCEANMIQKTKVIADGEVIDMDIDSKIKLIMKPEYKAQIIMNTDTGSSGTYDTNMFVCEEQGSYYSYTNSNGGGWFKQQIDESLFNETMESYNKQMNFDIYLSNIDRFSITGKEKVDGQDTIILEGSIIGDTLAEVIEQTQITSQFGMEDYGDLYKNIGDLPVKFWINKKTYMPVKIYMNMGKIMDHIMKEALSDKVEQVNCLECSVEMRYESFNDMKDIQIPQEALNADSY